jgi:hypothetical protein
MRMKSSSQKKPMSERDARSSGRIENFIRYRSGSVR